MANMFVKHNDSEGKIGKRKLPVAAAAINIPTPSVKISTNKSTPASTSNNNSGNTAAAIYGGGTGSSPTTTTTSSWENTVNKYNTDYSSLDWLRPDVNNSIYNPVWERARLNTIDQMAAEMGYHNPYTYEDIFRQVYQPGAEAKLNQANAGTRIAQNRFNQGLAGITDAVMDAYREQDIGRIASGTSRGAMAANLYKNILGIEQESIPEVTDLANQYYQNYADYGANIAQAYEDAYNGSTAAQQYLADYAKDYYWDQQQSLNAKYTDDVNLAAQRYAADADAYVTALGAFMSQLIESNTTGGTTTTESGSGGSGGSGGFASSNNLSESLLKPLIDSTKGAVTTTFKNKKGAGLEKAINKVEDALNKLPRMGASTGPFKGVPFMGLSSP